MNVVYPVFTLTVQNCSFCAAYASQSWIKVLLSPIIGPCGLIKGRFRIFVINLLKQLNKIYFTVKITLYFTHSGYAHRCPCIVQASNCSLTGVLDTSYLLSVSIFLSCSVCCITFDKCMHVCVFFGLFCFFNEVNNLQSIFPACLN